MEDLAVEDLEVAEDLAVEDSEAEDFVVVGPVFGEGLQDQAEDPSDELELGEP